MDSAPDVVVVAQGHFRGGEKFFAIARRINSSITKKS